MNKTKKKLIIDLIRVVLLVFAFQLLGWKEGLGVSFLLISLVAMRLPPMLD